MIVNGYQAGVTIEVLSKMAQINIEEVTAILKKCGLISWGYNREILFLPRITRSR